MIENLGYVDYAIIAIAAIGSAVIKNGVGVGAGIFMLPFLSLVLPAKVALGLGAPIMLVSDIAGVVYYWKEWDKRELLLLLPPAVLGVVVGASMIKVIPNELFRFWVGLFAIGFSSYQLLKLIQSRPEASAGWVKRVPKPKEAIPLFFGFVGGMASSVIHAGGLVMSFYLIQKSRDKRAFVGTFVLFFAIINLLKVFAYVSIDILNVEIVLLAAIISPLIILGGFWGNALNKRVSQKTFRAVVLALILVIGIGLLIKT
ncbi:MAG: sulfite exporter TauE/SafE family protein [Desulfobacterales bacterium]|nr:sulfite exporter TauE/SafE family protein [Desulfobacterales bacterium]